MRGEPSFAPSFDVVRVKTDRSSHIEPPLDQNWSDLEKLGWHASVVSLDAHLPRIQVIKHSTNYQVESMSTGGFHTTWAVINGIELGARLAHRPKE